MKKAITLSRPNDKVQQVKSMSRAAIGSVPSRKVFVDKKSKKSKYPQKYDEDFSLKPKSSTDLEKRKVNTPDPNRTGTPYGGYSFDKKGHDEKVKRSGVSKGAYKTAVSASKYKNSKDSFDRDTDRIRRTEYKDTLKKKGIKTEGVLSMFRSKKKPEEQKSEKPNITRYDRYHDRDSFEVPTFKPEWQKYSSKGVKNEETEIKDPLKQRDEKWFKVKNKEAKKTSDEINRDRVGYVQYVKESSKSSLKNIFGVGGEKPGNYQTVKDMQNFFDTPAGKKVRERMEREKESNKKKTVGEEDESTPFKAAIAKQMAQHGADAPKVNNQMKRIDQKYKRIQTITK